jgi:hypothetical protein
MQASKGRKKFNIKAAHSSPHLQGTTQTAFHRDFQLSTLKTSSDMAVLFICIKPAYAAQSAHAVTHIVRGFAQIATFLLQPFCAFIPNP